MTCDCQTTGHEYPCPKATPANRLVGVYDVMQLDISWNCSAGNHSWLPWAAMDDGSRMTKCVHCGRVEQVMAQDDTE